jgi:hypothetical protein
VAGKQRVAAVHGRAADGVFDKVGVDVDAAVVQEQPEAVLTLVSLRGGTSFWFEAWRVDPALCPTIDTDPK